MHNPYSKQPVGRLEEELTSHLAPVVAPDELWERVEAGLSRGPRHRWGPAWALAACVVLALAAGALWAGFAQQRSLWKFESAALQAHADWSTHPERLDLRTGSARELRAWLAAHDQIPSAVALERPRPDPDGLELMGACQISARRTRMVAIAYRVGVYPATLLIARGEGSPEMSKRIAAAECDGLKLYTWRAHGQVYTLVSSVPDPSQRACGLCHVEPQQRQMILHTKITG